MSLYDDGQRETHLTEEELERQIERLTAPRHPPAAHDPFDVCPSKYVSSEELAKLTDRLYTQSLERKAASAAATARAAYGASRSTAAAKLTPEQQEQAVSRLYTDAVRQKETNMKALQRQHQYHPPHPSKKVPLNDFVQRMYTDGLEAQRKKEQRLHDLYLAPTEIRTGTISRAQAEDSANRLSATKSGAQ